MQTSPASAASVEGALQKQLLNHGFKAFKCNIIPGHGTSPYVHTAATRTSVNLKFLNLTNPRSCSVKVFATRRRRLLHQRSDTYVLLEPGQEEQFVSQEELQAKLKGYLENWPRKNLPQDLARFESIDDAVSFLVNSVCELEIDGDVGSVQWYEVHLE